MREDLGQRPSNFLVSLDEYPWVETRPDVDDVHVLGGSPEFVALWVFEDDPRLGRFVPRIGVFNCGAHVVDQFSPIHAVISLAVSEYIEY